MTEQDRRIPPCRGYEASDDKSEQRGRYSDLADETIVAYDGFGAPIYAFQQPRTWVDDALYREAERLKAWRQRLMLSPMDDTTAWQEVFESNVAKVAKAIRDAEDDLIRHRLTHWSADALEREYGAVDYEAIRRVDGVDYRRPPCEAEIPERGQE